MHLFQERRNLLISVSEIGRCNMTCVSTFLAISVSTAAVTGSVIVTSFVCSLVKLPLLVTMTDLMSAAVPSIPATEVTVMAPGTCLDCY